MSKAVFAILLAFIVSTAFADEWYSIDGFTIQTGTDISIVVEGAGSNLLGFSFDGDPEPAVVGLLLESDSAPVADHDMGVLMGLTMVRAIVNDSSDLVESIELSPYATPLGIDGRWMTVFSTKGWHDLFFVRFTAPGGIYDTLVLVPESTGADGRDELDRLLDSFLLVIEEAAG